LHADAEHGYRALTVPLVNVRWSAQRCLPPRAAKRMIEASSRLFYQERTEGAVLDLVPARFRGRFRLIDLKAEDARQVLRATRAARPRPVRPREPAPSSLVRRRRLLATAQADGAGEMARAGLRRALLAGWARELGLRPAARELERARAHAPRCSARCIPILPCAMPANAASRKRRRSPPPWRSTRRCTGRSPASTPRARTRRRAGTCSACFAISAGRASTRTSPRERGCVL